jgi:hypothetical protein
MKTLEAGAGKGSNSASSISMRQSAMFWTRCLGSFCRQRRTSDRTSGGGANNNVGSGYWTFSGSSRQTVYLTKNKSLNLSAYEMYEFHTTQEGTGTRPGDTFDLDYSLMRAFALGRAARGCRLV